MRTNFILIDFENIQPDSLELLSPDHFRVLLFVGANQAKLPFETVASIQKLGTKADYVKIAGSGPNALDFHIAYYIGMHSASEPTAYFHIVSKDAGFDPLIEHLKQKKVLANRVKAINEIPAVKVTSAKSLTERVQIVADRLAQPKYAKPRTLKTLGSSITSFLHNQVSDEEVSAVIAGLAKLGVISIVGTKITYLPSNAT